MASKNELGDLRIVFMGTPDFAVASLGLLVASGYTVVGVVTAPDKPAGRGRTLQQSAVKRYALEKGIKVLQPSNLKNPAFLEDLKELNAHVQVVVAFRMLPREVWQMPELGTFNLHASLLPQYRGAAPINWAIINGEKKTGVTTFFIDEKIDTGAIILQEEALIQEDDDAGALHDRLMGIGAILVLRTVELIGAGNVVATQQAPQQKLRSAPKIFKQDCRIDWTIPADGICNFVRGLSPYPTAWTHLHSNGEEKMMKIFKVVFEKESHEDDMGSVVFNKKQLKVAADGGFIHILTAQLSGKRKMEGLELVNGLRLEEGAKVV